MNTPTTSVVQYIYTTPSTAEETIQLHDILYPHIDNQNLVDNTILFGFFIQEIGDSPEYDGEDEKKTEKNIYYV